MRSDVSPDRDTDLIDRVQDYTGENVNADTFLKVLAGHQVCLHRSNLQLRRSVFK